MDAHDIDDPKAHRSGESSGAPPPHSESSRFVGIARELLGELDVEMVLRRTLASAKELGGARYAALGVLDDAGSQFARFLASGIDEPTRRLIGPLPTGHGVLGELIRNPVPLRLTDIGSHPRSYGFPSGHPSMHSFLGVPVSVGGRPFGSLILAERIDGRPFSEEDETRLGLLAELAGVALDHALRFSRSEATRSELQAAVRALEATTQIARALAGEIDLPSVLELVAKRGRALVAARALVIELKEGDDLVVGAAAGHVPPGLVGRRIPMRDSVASTALATLRTQLLADELNHMRFREYGLGHLGIEADDGMVVPLALRGHGYGALVALDRLEDGPTFSATDQLLLESFAASAATAVATARSVAAERQREHLEAAEKERSRWARELHDETLQGLAGLALALSAARRSTPAEALDGAIDEAIAGLHSEIVNLRSLITELRPAALDELGVGAAIAALTERTRLRDVDVDLRIDLAYEQGHRPTRLSAEIETAIYRIIQEALTNAQKHGRASRAVVEVLEDDAAVRLRIRDDGRGFDPSVGASGFGLLGMQERAELLHGVLSIESAPGCGTTLRVTLPAQHRDGAVSPGAARA